ncbi:kinase-like domain-containing protein [Chlamydoabsidia padenii]|nr:kinase-like domain-containing protein [Chlamydoabsidia padenii]
MSNELLLRLFRSEFFNSWIAVSYLFRYSGNLGIQHYLCSELNTFPLSEIEFFLPQLIHLFITRPSDSVALECFLVDLCEKSTHMAIMTLWYLQAYVSDLSANPNSPSFALCRRLLNKCQTIVFSDGQTEDLELADAASSMNLGLSTHKVHENALPALVGIGAMLTAIGQPLMTKAAGQIAIAQGRRNSITSSSSTTSLGITRRNTLNGVSSTTLEQQDDTTVIHPTDEELLSRNRHSDNIDHLKRQSTASTSSLPQQQTKHDTPFQSSSQPELPLSKRRMSQFNPFTSSPSLEDLHHGKAFAMSRYLKSAQNKLNRRIQLRSTSSASSLQNKSLSSRKSSSSKSNLSIFDPALTALGQSSVPTNSTTPLSPALTHCSSDDIIRSNKHSHLARHSYTSSSFDSPSAFNLSDGCSNDDDDDGDDNDDDNASRQSVESASTIGSDNSTSPLGNIQSSHKHGHKNGNSNLNGDDDDSDEDDGYQTLSRLDTDHRKLLLKSNYFRTEIQFLLALVDIATRLVIVPKPARMSALHAELALLNHNLPAEVCLPLWCPATMDKPYHHRVVRINPSDAVVLNSAERAPYLLMIEVLEDEMSFDEDYMSTLYRMRRHKRSTNKKKTRREEVGGGNDMGSLKISNGGKKKGRKRHHHTKQPLSSQQQNTVSSTVPVVDMGDCLGGTAAATLTARTSLSNDSHQATTGEGESTSMENTGGGSPSCRRRQSSPSLDDHAERMRTAAVMLAQLQQNTYSSSSAAAVAASGSNGEVFAKTLLSNGGIQNRQGTEQIRQKIIKEMLALEDQRMEKMKKEGASDSMGENGQGTCPELLEDERYVAQVVNKEDPSAAVFSEEWEVKKARIRASSPYGHLPNWRLLSVIVKQGTDLRQEQFAIQLIREMQRIWQDTSVDVWVKYFRVLVTSDGSGLIETLRNTISVHSIKKNAYIRGWNTKGMVFHLNDYYEKQWGPPDSDEYIKAQDAFMRSLAGYSIACYILQIKDRHNGNILVDEDGHLIHIDFGFMLSNSPGSVGFEMAPFKLPQEYIDILGGVHGEKFAEYKALMKAAFLSVRKHSENILLLVEMMCKDSKQGCFQSGEQTIHQLRDRFQLHLTEPQAEDFVDRMIMSSCCNVFTRLYDTYQYYSQVKAYISEWE